MRYVLYRRVLPYFLLCGIFTSTTSAGGKLGIYGIRMVPHGTDAESYSRESWGAGLHAVFPVEQISNLVAGTGGFDFINLVSETITYQDPATGTSYEQQGDPNYYRFYLGVQFGGHGNGFLRPHAGFNFSLADYRYPDDIVIYHNQGNGFQSYVTVTVPDHIVFGYDLSLGLDLNFSNTIALDGGVKYLTNFGVAQPRGQGSVTIYPRYFEIVLGIGYSLDFLNSEGD